MVKKLNENAVKSVIYRTDEMEEQIESDLKISELKGASTMNDDCVDKFIVDLQEAQLSQQGGLSIGLQMTDGAEPESGRFTGAKRRKSGSVKRFKQEIGSGVPNDRRNGVAVGFDSMANDLHRITRVESSRNICDIIEIIKPVSYSSSITSNIHDFSVTFMAKRSDGEVVLVDNKFLKANYPVLLINYYEKYLRYTPA